MTDDDLTRKLDELGYNSPRLFLFCKSLLAAGASEGQAEPVAWAVYWGIGNMRPNSVHFEKETAVKVASEIKSHTELRPLYDHRPFIDEFCKAYAEEWQDTLKEQSDCIKSRDAELAALRARIAELESKQ